MHHAPGVPWILVGNKADLLEDKTMKKQMLE
jgi:GTPase SAR1 family protein